MGSNRLNIILLKHGLLCYTMHALFPLAASMPSAYSSRAFCSACPHTQELLPCQTPMAINSSCNFPFLMPIPFNNPPANGNRKHPRFVCMCLMYTNTHCTICEKYEIGGIALGVYAALDYTVPTAYW